MNVFLRILVAVIVVFLLFALTPLVFSVLGLALSSQLIQIFRLCAAGAALLYILLGRWF